MVTSNASVWRGSSTTSPAPRASWSSLRRRLQRRGCGSGSPSPRSRRRRRCRPRRSPRRPAPRAVRRRCTCSGSPVPSSSRTRTRRPGARRWGTAPARRPARPSRRHRRRAGRSPPIGSLGDRNGLDACGPAARPRTNRPMPDSTSPGTAAGSLEAGDRVEPGSVERPLAERPRPAGSRPRCGRRGTGPTCSAARVMRTGGEGTDGGRVVELERRHRRRPAPPTERRRRPPTSVMPKPSWACSAGMRRLGIAGERRDAAEAERVVLGLLPQARATPAAAEPPTSPEFSASTAIDGSVDPSRCRTRASASARGTPRSRAPPDR